MVHNPSTQEEISESIESRLKGRITKLTNFVQSSFNKLFLDAFAEQLYEYEIRLLASQLSGWVEFAGGPIEEEDLDRLGLNNFDDLERLNEHMEDDHLDNLGLLVGVTRSPGERATGEVRINVFADDTRVPDGLRVSTPPDPEGDTETFVVDLADNEDYVTPNDQNNPDFVDVSIIAETQGSDHNVGSGTITRFRSPPPGLESVTNPTSTTGGEDEETNDELRERIKNAVFETSGGGTTEGIRGYIIGNVEGANDVFVDEFFDNTPPYVDVIVDGGVEGSVWNAIETSRPAGIRHNLIRPVTHEISVTVELKGTDIDPLTVQQEIEEYIFNLDLGEDFIEDKVVQRIMNVEPDIENVLAFNTHRQRVLNERILYETGTDQYDLADAPLGFVEDERHYFENETVVYRLGQQPVDPSTVTVEAIVGGSSDTILTQGASEDYEVVDSTGDGFLDAIDFSPDGVDPDDATVFEVDYETVSENNETFSYSDTTQDYALAITPALAGGSVVTDDGSTTYTLGEDYDIVDTDGDGERDTLRWLDSPTDTPNDGQDFTVDYELDLGSITSVTGVLNDTEETTFVEGTDFDELDGNSDGHPDQIDWSVGGDSPDDQTNFSVDYSVANRIPEDFAVSQREKVSPNVDQIRILTYD